MPLPPETLATLGPFYVPLWTAKVWRRLHANSTNTAQTIDAANHLGHPDGRAVGFLARGAFVANANNRMSCSSGWLAATAARRAAT